MEKQIILAALLVSVIIVAGCTQQQEKIYRIGILSGSDAFVSIADGFKTKMTDMGYVEGKNVVYDFQKLNADPAGYDRVSRKFVADKVDLIFAFPTEPAISAKAATEGTGIPVIFAHAGLENSGIVNSAREPGENLSGTRFPGPDLIAKRLEFLLELAPNVRRLYVPYDKNYPLVPPALDALRPTAASRNVTLVELPAATLDDLRADLEMRNKSAYIGVDAILLLPELMMQSPDSWTNLSEFAKAHKIPIVGSSDALIKKGSILTYNVNPIESGGLAATIADKVLRGTSAGTIPVVTPEAYLKINYNVTQELGLNVSESLLAMAKEIIR